MEDLPKPLKGLPLDHIGIAVHDVEAAAQAYTLLGLSAEGEDEIIASQHVKVRALRAGESLIELLEPSHETSPIAKFIDKRGTGLHHIALRVMDIVGKIERLETEGAEFISSQVRAGRAGTKVVFLHPKWASGVLIELVEHA